MRLLDRILLLGGVCGTALGAMADVVHVVQCQSYGGEDKQLSDLLLDTGADYTSVSAPAVSGYVFTHWSIDCDQVFTNRDAWGRSHDAVTYHLYEDTTLTANYVPKTQDEDGDGVADGYELYWYGDLDENADSDTDNDGRTFAAELAASTNPLFPDEDDMGEILNFDSGTTLYNPSNYAPYIIRSEPEGKLFATITEYAQPGASITTSSYSPKTSDFAYWTINGSRVRDNWGVSCNSVTFTATVDDITECIAVCVTNEQECMSYYWYGDALHDEDSDSDNDGFTFAQELANDSNPVFPDESETGEVLNFDSGLVQYNPHGWVAYVIRSEPEGELFATQSDYKEPGTAITTPSLAPTSSTFAYWTLNGQRQQDAWGIAVNSVTFDAQTNDVVLIAYSVANITNRYSQYWYGDEAHSLDSDTDEDGFPLSDEVANGTNPVFPDESETGEVLNFDTATTEVNAQPYEQPLGMLVDNAYEQMFTSTFVGNDATSTTFIGDGSRSSGGNNGVQIWPVVADVDGDGLWDLIVCSESSTNVFLNVGTKGNPQFANCGPDGAAGVRALPAGVLEMNSTAKFADMSLDVDPVNALSATTNCATMLVSDTEGRIWLYVDANVSFASNEDGSSADAFETNASTWVLQHKVWGGSYAGFAEGLMLAAVDWEDDGDLDCICGTADGKLMLLRDPKVGRPTGLEAEAGVDSVVLNWDPNPQSRVRGYKVYRAVDDSADYGVRGAPALPTYRDSEVDPSSYSYKVTAMSRFYTAGNSTPTVTESIASDPVMATVGTVKLAWNDEKTFTKTNVEVRLSIENAMNLSGEGGTLVVNYDPAKLTPVKVQKSGLTDDVTVEYSFVNGVWNVTLNGGNVSAGSGTFLTFVFAVGDVEAGTTTVSLASATLKSNAGSSVPVALPDVDAKIELVVYNPPEPAHAVVTVTDSVSVTSGVSFVVAVAVSGDDINADSLQYTFDYDTSLLTYANGEFTAGEVTQVVTTVISLKDVSVNDADGAAAIVDSCGSVSVAILPKADESDPGDGDEIGDNDDGDDDTFPDWNEQEKGITKFGLAAFDIGEVAGKTGETVSVPIMLRSHLYFRDLSVDYSTFRFRLAYDSAALEPVGVTSDVGTFTFSAKDGVITVLGKSGSQKIGRFPATRIPLTIEFKLLEQYSTKLTAIVATAVQIRTTDGAKVYTPARLPGAVAITFVRQESDPSAVAVYGRGDLNGDGRLTKEDRQLLAELMNGKQKKVTSQQLAAGDYNGNGRLDNGDYQLLLEDFRERGIINGKGGNR